MNLRATEQGLAVEEISNGWFDENYIHFKFRLRGRKLTFPWIFGVARAIFLIEKIKKHDWLRRRAGEIEPFKKDMIKGITKLFLNLLKYPDKFFDIQTSDITINSRNLLRNLVSRQINTCTNCDRHGFPVSPNILRRAMVIGKSIYGNILGKIINTRLTISLQMEKPHSVLLIAVKVRS